MAFFIPEDKISEIKNAVDIVEIVSEVVLLKKTGNNFVGLCPFHSEKTPSFTVSPDKQIFHCFGCGTGGNIFSFLMKHDGVTFPEAARQLAKRCGVEIPSQHYSPEQRRRLSEKESLQSINKLALEYFSRALGNESVGKSARSYLQKRGMTPEMIKCFKIGYAPGGWDNLLNFLTKKRFSPQLIEKSGLIIPRKNKSGFYDRFRERLIFPIINIYDQVIGFGGRVLDDSLPKYLNSPETPLYNKSRSLYGLNIAKDKCRSADTVFIVEGYLDLIALHQNGIGNSVATLGTALTAEHIRLLTRYASRMVLVYDSDEAGIRSAQRCIDVFWNEHADFRRGDVFNEKDADTHIMVLPAGHDPDSFLMENGPEAFHEEAAKAPGIITFLIDCAIKKHSLSVEGKIRIIADMVEPLAAINDSVARSLYIRQLAERLEVSEAAILEKTNAISIKGAKRFQGRFSAAATDANRQTKRGVNEADAVDLAGSTIKIEQKIIAMMLQFPEILSEIEKRNVLDHFENNRLKSIGSSILSRKFSSSEQVSELISETVNDDEKQLIAALAFKEEDWTLKGCLMLVSRFVEAGKRRRDSNRFDEQIKAAE